MNNTFVNKLNHKMSILCLHTKDLDLVGENHYGATKRIHALHIKISHKPNIANSMDEYIKEQVDNENFIPININASRKKDQPPVP